MEALVLCFLEPGYDRYKADSRVWADPEVQDLFNPSINFHHAQFLIGGAVGAA
jgi:hypothetical protein